MREILFRGKRTDDGKWVSGRNILLSEEGYAYIVQTGLQIAMLGSDGNACVTMMMPSCEVDPKTVGQFTGLTDKNGKKIFEGDIVVCRKEISGNWIDYCVEIGFVEMKHGAFGLHRKQGYYRPFKDWLEDYEYEVIGNIHDNPELLEKG